MVYWCCKCGALIGLREPRTDWSTNRSLECQICQDRGKSETATSAKSEISGVRFDKPINSDRERQGPN